jgi:predicted N-acyltransferase
LAHHRQEFVPALAGLRLRIVLFSGHAADSQTPFTVAYIGEGDSLAFFQHSLFTSDRTECNRQGNCFTWRAPARALALADDVDIVLLERNNLLSWTPTSGEWRTAPPWLRMVRDFGPDESRQQLKQSMRHQRRNIRYVRRGGYRYRFSDDDADFDFYYHHMYLPFTKVRHEDRAIVSDEAYLRSAFRRGTLMMALTRGERPVAAQICMVRDNVLYLVGLGVLDGDLFWMQDGAVSALYFYTIQWAHEQGLRHADWGRCRPFVTDGRFRHKKRWGLRPAPDPWVHSEWLFWIPSGSAAARAWLQAHPFVPSFSQSGGGVP